MLHFFERSKDAKHSHESTMSASELGAQLSIAIEEEDTDQVRSLITAGAPIRDATLLEKAIESGSSAIFTLLYEAKASAALSAATKLPEKVAFALWPTGEKREVLARLKQWKSLPPLLEAALLGNMEKLKAEAKLAKLSPKSAISDITRDSEGRNTLHYACVAGDLPVVEFLLRNPAIFLTKWYLPQGIDKLTLEFAWDYHRRSALHISAGHGHVKITERLLEEDCDISQQTRDSHTACHLAAQNGQLDIVKLFIDKGFPLQEYPQILHNAKLPILEYFLQQAGQLIDSQGKGIALLYAAAKGRKAEVELLLRNAATITLTNSHDETALDLAVKAAHVKIAEILFEQHRKNKNWSVADFASRHLLTAIKKGHVAMVDLLLRHKASVEEIEINHFATPFYVRRTALHIAAEKGHAAIIMLLLDNQASVNETDNNGETALHLAARNSHTATATLLLNRNAAINAGNKHGYTALHQARNSEMASLLLAARASVDARTEHGDTPLHTYARDTTIYGSACSEMLHLLIRNSADINATNSLDTDILTLACTEGYYTNNAIKLEKIRLLLKYKAEVKPSHLDLPEIKQAQALQEDSSRALALLTGFHSRNKEGSVLRTAERSSLWPHDHGLTYLILRASVRLPNSKPLQASRSTSSASSLLALSTSPATETASSTATTSEPASATQTATSPLEPATSSPPSTSSTSTSPDTPAAPPPSSISSPATTPASLLYSRQTAATEADAPPSDSLSMTT